ncbi:PREDICTED: uncharacterized protein LOC105312714 [Amphimedon queenslandica]|uniref:AIG1-type G domain-containing protein n=1 Tax=Amphimedon queenslandica TaxID=400682 RepID=A0AAN0IMG5_AMPQE|nr:PREDICTED: uncharacterized protein LOC105312714 [Amphimedon queenslandica]|eukprot:XP_011403880.1 PREDICTED: uncharacterized protein LOC105312714 [Amphimedon queenslandica]
MASKFVILIAVCISLISLTGGGNAVPSVKILVVGKTGSGKSTLINGLFGSEKVEVDGHDTLESDSVTKDVECFVEIYESGSEKEPWQKFNVTICDSPGFQDTSYSDEEYIEKLKSKCNDPDLVLYVVSMRETRWTIDQVETITLVNKALGTEIWNSTLLVLTFANEVEDIEKKNEFLKKFVQSLDKIGVKAGDMPVALAGHLLNGEGDHLPEHNITYWYTELLIKGVKQVKTKGVDALMLLILKNKDKVHVRSNESDIFDSWAHKFSSFPLKATSILFFEGTKAVICYVFNSKISMAVIAIVIFTISVTILPFGWLFASVVGVIAATTGYIIAQNITGELCNKTII